MLFQNNLALIPLLVALTGAIKLGDLSYYTKISDSKHLFTSGNAGLQVTLLDSNVIRVQADSNRNFIEPKLPIVIQKQFEAPKVSSEDQGNYQKLSTPDGGELRVYKKPLRIAYYKNEKSVFEESVPLDLDFNGSIQTLKRQADEQFFGGGMQNGRFSHRDTSINITVSYNWSDGGNPNPAPFYISSKGYGAFRNTFAPGAYSFKEPLQLTHKESRFDAYYFIGDFKQVLNKYTQLTGRPFMPPAYGLELGDADCYLKTANGRPPKKTLIDSTKVAQGYVDNDMPVGWMLVNDGYGCGYEQLDETNKALASRNVSLGLWTESDLINQPNEVGKWGVRVRKLDVKWVGKGYDFAFNACNLAYNGIQDNSDARGFVWLVEGWAGSQKCAVQWTGDQSGSWENIRFHIPTIHGSGNSAQVYTAGDIDGIFGGSVKTYVRDLQYKVFTPVLMTMSGWASTDKQPWRFEEPAKSINRKYLKLREQLMPYIYTLAYEAYTTGYPIVRSTVLEYPEDPKTWDKDTTKYQYLFGSSFLVAPVYKDELKRDGIYFPKGNWIDYWSNKLYNGPSTVDGYNAPLDTLPLFVKEGSIIPMWPSVNSFRERKPNHRILLDIFPSFSETSTFTLYEDDFITRDFQSKQFSLQQFSVSFSSNKSLNIKIGSIQGSFNGSTTNRPYTLILHTSKPYEVKFEGSSELTEKPKLDAITQGKPGWFYDATEKSGITYIALPTIDSSKEFTISVTL